MRVPASSLQRSKAVEDHSLTVKFVDPTFISSKKVLREEDTQQRTKREKP
jgi:hypothetical protein